ncbi:DUF5723 family protein [Pricia sp. S334]|uniref:DUF5723 family protein n=1 Tax=Pricia mediterranea TaxID=3076079 RepID=A0ABU3L2I1_9FLAO|nr:DUF5723 family protein [Pricia sp. S334]MDT7827954.1 DUF5723 family protein [Pricia sp. S334]
MRIPHLLFIVLLWACIPVKAQNKQLLYDFTEIPQAGMVNPGMETDFHWYAGIPGVSGIMVQAGSSGISVNDIFANDGLDINDKVRERAVYGMKPTDELSGTFQVEFLNFGFRGRDPDLFYSGGMYLEGDAIGYWFQDYAILAIEGNADRLNQRFDVGHLKTRGELMNVLHFGINKKINRDLILGGRAKIYSSVFDFNSTKNRGYFVTTEGERNIFATTLNADAELRTSGLESLYDAREEGNIASTAVKRALFGGNLGLGVDLGFTYYLNEQTVLTGSLLDLGLIYHTNDVNNYTLKGSATVEGVVITPEGTINPDTDFWEDLVDDVESLVPYEENSQSYVAFRPTKLHASLRYNFGETVARRGNCKCGTKPRGVRLPPKYANSVGGQLYMINRPRGPQAALTAFYLRRIGNIMAVKGTYTVDKFSYTNLGLGLNLQLGPANLYAMADNLLSYRNLADSRYASFQLGLNIIAWE